ncbi:MAG: ribonuclease III [Parvibaculaceae bacterium]
MADPFKELEGKIGYRFTDRTLAERALTHASTAIAEGSTGYERLEFLGDRVLGLIVADLLYRRFPAENEGDLAVRLNALVRAETCADVARELDLGAALRMTKGEEKAGAALRGSILADVCEALIAAIYLDGGVEKARGFVETFWEPRLDAMGAPPRDAKTELQEWAQSQKLGLPAYRHIGRSGPDHAPIFEVEVELTGKKPVFGTGASKRAAEQAAAEAMLQREGIRE